MFGALPHRQLRNCSLLSTILGGFSSGGLWGTLESYRFVSPNSIPGSGDPWIHLVGLILYGAAGAIIALILRAFFGARLHDTGMLSGPIFVFLFLTLLTYIHVHIVPNAPYYSIVGLALSFFSMAICVGFFLIVSFLFQKFGSIRVVGNITRISFLIVLGIVLWNSPLKNSFALSHAGSESSGVSSGRPNVVFITLDTTRADHLSLYGYHRKTTPFLDSLANSGTVMDKAYSVSSWTLPSHSSFFTGCMPSVHGTSWSHWWLSSSENTLAEILKQHGYQTAGFVSGPFLLSTLNIAQGFDFYDDQLDFASSLRSFILFKIVHRFWKFQTFWWDGQRDANNTTTRVVSWMKNRSDSRPLFLFLNYFDPHDPYRAAEPFRCMFCNQTQQTSMNGYIRGLSSNRTTGERKKGGKNGVPLSAEDYERLQALYDGEIRFMDEQLAKLFQYFRASGFVKNTIFIIAADHGESIGDHRIIDHGHTLYEEQIRIPFIILGPGLPSGKRMDNLIRSVDLLPTLLELLRIPTVLEKIQGKSFLTMLTHGEEIEKRIYIGEINPDPRSRVRAFQREQKAILRMPMKLLWSSQGNAELYELTQDPEEKQNLFSLQHTAALELQQQLLNYLSALPKKTFQPQQRLDESTLESLKANNYLN